MIAIGLTKLDHARGLDHLTTDEGPPEGIVQVADRGGRGNGRQGGSA
jgi:hypothetical protein